MRKFILIVLILYFTVNSGVFAQFGIRAGANFSNLKFDDVQTTDYSITMLKDKKAGYHLGFFGRISFFGAFIQPELLFNSTSNTFEVEDLATNEKTLIKQKFNKLSIPVIAGKKMKFIRFGLGPVATILLSNESDFEKNTNTSYKEKFNSATFGYQLDLGIDVWDIAIDFKLEGNLSKFGDGIVVGGEKRSFDSRERQYIVSVGYFF